LHCESIGFKFVDEKEINFKIAMKLKQVVFNAFRKLKGKLSKFQKSFSTKTKASA